ncbi:MAG: hypothetical protein JSW64_07940 [Candidatus Zixiibacteriota bacterium]|nr:MAG: hypothetical protein JSW64_07940 [candidate division Zixibacteria bacterium]
MKNCESCHEAGKQISAEKCLQCHKILNERISGGKGLHKNEGYDDCVSCHVEHLGRDNELIWWPDGIENFDHSQTGYKLEGKHGVLDCRKCHKGDQIKRQAEFLNAGKDLNRTFLGLDTACLNCHQDQHRGQVGEDCLKCHAYTGWKPASGFDHSGAAFPLEGRHLEVQCTNCHTVLSPEDSPDLKYIKFTGIKHGECTDCHEDIHRGKFDQACRTCHNTSGWRNVNRADFDHGKTRFSLEGKHAALACEKCHEKGKPLAGLKFSRCMDCHTDYHTGQFVRRESRGECAECHTVIGFAPSLFTIENHQKTEYPLEGSHLAIPCIACHKAKWDESGSAKLQFTFESTDCNGCHNNPHGDRINQYMKPDGCRYCHNVSGWKAVSYDHGPVGFTLEGRHARTSCVSCHKPVETNGGVRSLVFSGRSRECLSCHADIHRGQFQETAIIDGVEKQHTECQRCHTPGNWFPDRFDHNRDADFKLEGAHLKARCSGCHKRIEEPDNTFVWFRPVDKKCESCHGSSDLNLEAGEND